MKKYQKNLMGLLVILLGTAMFMTSCQDSETAVPDNLKTTNSSVGNTTDSICGCILNPSESLTPAEIEMLNYMREEEKLARDVYITLYEQYQLQIFENILNSEQVHMDKILCLLEYYDLEDPAMTEIGAFSNEDLQALYNSLIEQGSISETDALTVGATIEDVDIFDLKENMTQTLNEAILTIFGNLECGSENHIRAFSKLLAKDGVFYTPQYISQEDFDAILSATSGNCGNGNGGNGNGGNGNCGNGGNGNGGNGNGGNGNGGNGNCGNGNGGNGNGGNGNGGNGNGGNGNCGNGNG